MNNWVTFWYRKTPIKSKVKSGCKSCDTHTRARKHTHACDSLCSQSVFWQCFSPTHHLSPRQASTALQSSDQSERLQHFSWLLENGSVCAAAQSWLSESPNPNLNWKCFCFLFCQFSSFTDTPSLWISENDSTISDSDNEEAIQQHHWSLCLISYKAIQERNVAK